MRKEDKFFTRNQTETVRQSVGVSADHHRVRRPIRRTVSRTQQRTVHRTV